LVLQYTGGSPCDTSTKKEGRDASLESAAYNSSSEVNDTPTSLATKKSTTSNTGSDSSTTERRKSATISFLCNQDPTITEASVSFVDMDPYECAYFFEVRSPHACATAEPHKPGSLGPGSVFAVILLIAVLVYVVGGIFYQRTVAHARGWRQLPNYSLWAGIWSFLQVRHIRNFIVGGGRKWSRISSSYSSSPSLSPSPSPPPQHHC
jgi:cation-dependent mannose-6-phosphate receptor